MEISPKIIAIYETEDGQRPFRKWLDSLKDRVTVARINARLLRLQQGNLGDVKSVNGSVSELRLAFGPGYRIYLGQEGDKLVVLLSGGDKSTQEKDIKLAHDYWADYLRRTHHEKN